jgi:hypothetical protein
MPPSGRRYPKAYEETGSPLFWINRITVAFASPPVPANSEVDLLSIPDWKTFGGVPDSESPGKGTMETTVHDTVHGFVGKDMSSTSTSARDPIFWAHHANLDRIWLEWQAQWKQDPSEPGFVLPGVPGTQGDWVDVSEKYAYGPTAVSAPFMFEAHRVVAVESLKPALAPSEPLKLASDNARVVLKITDIDYPKDSGPFISARVFLVPINVTSETTRPGFAKAHYLGYFTHWLTSDMHAGHHAAGKKASIAIDVTARAKAILSLEGDKPLALSFELMNQDENGEKTPLKFGSPGGMSFKASLEVVRVQNGNREPIQKLETKSLR